MAKNKNNSPKNAGNKNNSGSVKDSIKNTSQSAKNSHAEVPDDSPRRSGPGGA